MTVDDVRERLRHIISIAIEQLDSEEGHRAEDGLYIAVLQYVAACPDTTQLATLREIAAEALKARKLDFDRWYA